MPSWLVWAALDCGSAGPAARSGRKITVEAALLDPADHVLALARGTWFAVALGPR